MLKPFRTPVCAAAALLAFTACSGSSSTGSSTPSRAPASAPSSAPATPTPGPSETPVTAATAVPSPVPAKPARTAAQLTKALLALSDLPAGFSLEKNGSGDNSDVTVSAKDSRCAKLVALTNADNPPGSKASAGQSYSGGAEGPFVDESIDAMGSPAAVRALQKSFKQAITACRTLTLKVAGAGSSPISVREVSAPRAGTDPVAVRFTATSGALEGFEVIMVTTGVDDVVVAVTVVNGLPDDVDGATSTAVEKAQRILAVTPSGT
ncbi:hypothetical protein JOF29_007070 [Kribbella aluminosa]|uniref:PknH-like protein n=1 Tax=Kribbella aluminosa TaxID=416017 RepID=A0ABS4UWE0_9ACTN|nr:hypothetical protein [Kribbella aluminosa]MBP2355960.1 hypothetical protein [Kribbella aluminosa]